MESDGGPLRHRRPDPEREEVRATRDDLDRRGHQDPSFLSRDPRVPPPLGSIGRGDDFTPGGPDRGPVARLEVASAERNLDRPTWGREVSLRHHISPQPPGGRTLPCPVAATGAVMITTMVKRPGVAQEALISASQSLGFESPRGARPRPGTRRPATLRNFPQLMLQGSDVPAFCCDIARVSNRSSLTRGFLAYHARRDP